MPRTKYMTTITSVDPRFSKLNTLKDIDNKTILRGGRVIEFDTNSKINGVVVAGEIGYEQTTTENDEFIAVEPSDNEEETTNDYSTYDISMANSKTALLCDTAITLEDPYKDIGNPHDKFCDAKPCSSTYNVNGLPAIDMHFKANIGKHIFKALFGNPTNDVYYGYFRNDTIRSSEYGDDITINVSMASQTYMLNDPKYKEGFIKKINADGVSLLQQNITLDSAYNKFRGIIDDIQKFLYFVNYCDSSSNKMRIKGGEKYKWKTFVRYLPKVVCMLSEKKLSDMTLSERKEFLSTKLKNNKFLVYDFKTTYPNIEDRSNGLLGDNSVYLDGTMFIYKINKYGNLVTCSVNGPNESCYRPAYTTNGVPYQASTQSYNTIYLLGKTDLEKIKTDNTFLHSDEWGNGLMYVLIENTDENTKNNIPYFLTKIKKSIKAVKNDDNDVTYETYPEVMEKHNMYRITSKESLLGKTNAIYCVCERNVMGNFKDMTYADGTRGEKYTYTVDQNIIFMNYTATINTYQMMKNLLGSQSVGALDENGDPILDDNGERIISNVLWNKNIYTYFFITPIGNTFDLHEYLSIVQRSKNSDTIKHNKCQYNVVNRQIDLYDAMTKYITNIYVEYDPTYYPEKEDSTESDTTYRIAYELRNNNDSGETSVPFTSGSSVKMYKLYNDFGLAYYTKHLLNLDTQEPDVDLTKWSNQNSINSVDCWFKKITDEESTKCVFRKSLSHSLLGTESMNDYFGWINSYDDTSSSSYLYHNLYDTSIENRRPSFILSDISISRLGINETKLDESYRSNNKLHYKKNGLQCLTPEKSIREYIKTTLPDIIYCIGDGNENGLFGNTNGCISKRAHKRRLISNRDVDLLRGGLPPIKLVHGNETYSIGGDGKQSYSEYVTNLLAKNTEFNNYTIKDYLNFYDIRFFTEYLCLDVDKFHELRNEFRDYEIRWKFDYNDKFYKLEQKALQEHNNDYHYLDSDEYFEECHALDYELSQQYEDKINELIPKLEKLNHTVINAKLDDSQYGKYLKKQIVSRRMPLLVLFWHNSLLFALKNLLKGIACGDICITTSLVLCKYGILLSETEMLTANQFLCDAISDVLGSNRQPDDPKYKKHNYYPFGFYYYYLNAKNIVPNLIEIFNANNEDSRQNKYGMKPTIKVKKSIKLSQNQKMIIIDNLKQFYVVFGYGLMFYGSIYFDETPGWFYDNEYLIPDNDDMDIENFVATNIKKMSFPMNLKNCDVGHLLYSTCNDPKYAVIKYNNYYRNDNDKLKTNKKTHVKFKPTINDVIIFNLFDHDYIDSHGNDIFKSIGSDIIEDDENETVDEQTQENP